MKALIAGAGGQLGRSLQAVLRDHEITALAHAQLDIVNLDEVRAAIAAHRPEIVINASAYNQVDGAEADPDGAYHLNARGPRNLALATAERGLPLLHVSTDYVFDGSASRPYHEYDQTNPLSVYGRSKLAGEKAVAALNPRHYIARTAWLYHERGRNFPLTMLAQREKAEVKVVSDQFGSPTYAPHLAAAIARLIETGAYGIYHLAGGGGTSWYELTRALYRHLGIATAIRAVATAEFPRPAPRPRFSVLATLQDPRILLPPWEEGLEAFTAALAST
jgi:dTDP-4-dehydrorhamnose reductase